MEVSKFRRLANWLVDSACVLFVFLLLLRVLPAGAVPPQHYRWLVLVAIVLYYGISEGLFRCTAGKLLTGTRVVAASGQPLGWGRVTLRTLCRLLPLEPFSVLFSGRALAWHDRLSGTRVVNAAD